MDVAAQLREALRIVDSAEVPRDLRPAALDCVFNALGGEDAQTATDHGSESVSGSSVTTSGLAQISSKLEVLEPVAERIYVIEADGLELVVPSGRLQPTKSRATEQIALLVAAGRQAAGLDDGWTRVDHIRSMCEHYRRLDSNNFATTIKAMDAVFVIRGSGRDRRVKMSAPGWQRAGELVSELSGGEG